MSEMQSSKKKLRTIHVNVKLQCGETEWRQVKARDLSDAIKVAQKLPLVVWVYEASYIPGGLVT